MLWVVAIAVEVVLLASLGGQATWLQRSLDVDHLLERVSLLVVIVFGESILATIAELDAHWTLPSGVTAVLAFLAISLLAWVFFRYASGSAEAGLRRLQSAGRIGALRDAVMYLPFILIAGIALFASGLGTAVAEAGHTLAPGAAVCIAGGIVLFYLASVAESLRYGVPWRDVVTWGIAGVVLPWVIVPLATVVACGGRGCRGRPAHRGDDRPRRGEPTSHARRARECRFRRMTGFGHAILELTH